MPPSATTGVTGRAMRGGIRRLVKNALAWTGWEIHRASADPVRQLLGLRHLPVRTIIDVGANTGQFARRALAVFPSSRLYCFEPLPEAFAALRRWAATRGETVTTFDVALGEEEGVVQALEHVDHPSSSSLLPITEVCERLYPFTKRQASTAVTLTTLDAVVGRLPALAPDILIKLDVQGYEDRVIRGGRRTFGEARACIVEIGLDILYQGQASFEGIVVALADLGYRYAGNLEQAPAGDGHIVAVDAVFVK